MQLDFNLPNGTELSITIPIEPQSDSPYERIWQNFLYSRLQDLVARSGFVYCGVYPEAVNDCPPGVGVASLNPDDSIAYSGYGTKHPETVSMHAFSCINLVSLLIDEFPELFVRDRPRVIGTYNRDVTRARIRLTRLLAIHDNGEAICGDIADDGSCPEAQKNATELQYLQKIVQCFESADDRKWLIYDLVAFQYPTAIDLYPFQTEYDRNLIQIAKLIDKVDAVLAALKNELEGHPGYLSSKAENYGGISAQDQRNIEICGTSAIADCWAVHFIADYHQFYGFDTIMNVLYTAVTKTRGEWYPWWDNFCEYYPTVKFTPPPVRQN